MPTETELRDAFYAALLAFVDNECGRTGETAVKRLAVGKNIISDARKGRPGDFRRPQDGTIDLALGFTIIPLQVTQMQAKQIKKLRRY